MERIKEALEKARLQQGESPGRTSARPHNPPTGEVGVDDVPITYSQTKVQTLSPAVLKRNRVFVGTEQDAAATAYKMLRTQVLQRMVAKGWNALAITSPGPGHGKTLTAINLAFSLAKEVHYTVLLVDLDMKRPSIHSYLGLTPAKGISDFMLRGTPLNEVMINPGVERLVILPGRESLADSSELLSSPKMAQMVDELKSRYPSRFILFDLPPLLSASDAMAFAPYVDAALMVIEEGKTKKEELQNALGLMGQTEIIGTVLNKSHEKVDPYY